MAKGIGVFLVLLGALVCVSDGDERVFVGKLSTVGDYVNPAEAYVNPIDPYVKPARVNAKGAEEAKLSARDRLQEIYMAEVGVRELSGRNDGERVEEYLRYTDLGEGYAWCASFVSWVYGQAGFPEPRTAWSPALFPAKRVIWEKGRILEKGPMVRPLEPQSGARGTSFLLNTKESAAEPRDAPVSLPQKGDVFGIYFNSLKRIAHAGFVDEWGDKYVVTVEGNTNEAGGREGDGVYRKRRLIGSIYRVAAWL